MTTTATTTSANGPFDVVLFDSDHTLFDFDGSKAISFARVVESAGGTDPAALLPVFSDVERPLWAALERGELNHLELNYARWAGLLDAAGLDADPAACADSYLDSLGRTGGLFPDARPLLDALHGKVRLALVTNGISRVMHTRLDHFEWAQYFETVVVSSELGVAKPSAAFFDAAFEGLDQPDRSRTIIVGDSLTSDMAGGRGYGITTCWFNPQQAPQPEGIDHMVHTLPEVAAVVLGA